jgi:fucose permease
MMRLNLLWAAGACAGPWLAVGGRALRHTESTTRPLHTLVAIAILFAALAVWVLLALSPDLRVLSARARGDRPDTPAVPLALLILVFGATGVEAATGGWLAAFAQRMGEGAATTVGAATAFWGGLLSSRLLHSLRTATRVSERLVLPLSTALIAAGLALLIGWTSGGASVLAALLAGFGVGPVYPLLLYMVLRRRESTGVFVLAGVGSAVIPLATGAFSHWAGSLAAGLCVPLAAAAMMTVLSLLRGVDMRVPALCATEAD